MLQYNKEINKPMEKIPTELGRIFACYISDK